MTVTRDAKTLQAMNGVLTKIEFERIVEDLADNERWHYDDLEKFRALLRFLEEGDNGFESGVLQAKAEHLRVAVVKIINFSALHFFVCDRHPAIDGKFLYRLYPRLQEKILDGDARAQQLWDGHVATLNGLCEELKRSHREFQNAAKAPARP